MIRGDCTWKRGGLEFGGFLRERCEFGDGFFADFRAKYLCDIRDDCVEYSLIIIDNEPQFIRSQTALFEF